MNLIKSLATSFLPIVFLLMTSTANANEGGSKGNLHVKMEPIVVNLMGSTQQCIKVELILQLAKQEADERVKLYMPVIYHKLIFLLSSKDANQLGSIEGKQKLIQESKDAINYSLGLTEKDGIADVFFSTFIIQ